jgi:ELWxxDGT repeat protein
MRNHPLRCLVLLLLFASPPALWSQLASLVKDISPQPAAGGRSSMPLELFAFRDKLLFSATEPSSGRELWGSDGEDRGTHLLADFCPGACDSTPRILGAMATGVVGYTELGSPYDPLVQLWRSDGTRDGTSLLPTPADPVALNAGFGFEVDTAFLANVVYFSGCNQAQGCGLWRSDGTAAGTRVLAAFDDSYRAYRLTAAASKLFFLNNRTLWVSDGTPGGTRAVADLPQGARLMTALGDWAVFTAGGPDGDELWVSDGTASGTKPLTNFAAPEPFNQSFWLKAMGGKVYFVADDVLHGAEIWATDGTAAGTRQVTDISFHDPFLHQGTLDDQIGLRITDLELLGDRLVFWATDGLHGFQPWSAKGATTAPLCAGCTFTNPRVALVKVGSHILFIAVEPQHAATQVWTTDGTTPGTALLHTACAFECQNLVMDPTLFLGSGFFTVHSDQGRTEMWTSDGTASGTRLFASPSYSSPQMAALGSTVFYDGVSPDNGYGAELWASDGTPAGTRLVTDISRSNASTSIDGLTAAGHNLFFSTCINFLRRFWYTEGTDASTVEDHGSLHGCGLGLTSASVGGVMLFPYNNQLTRMSPDGSLTEITQMSSGQHINQLAVLVDRLYFVVTTQSGPPQIWRSDGTAPGTGKVVDLPAGLSVLSDLQLVGAEFWFSTLRPQPGGGMEIWRSDGTQTNTRKVADFGPDVDSDPPQFTALGSTVFFVGPDHNDHGQLWRTDGTQAGTLLVRNLDPESFFSARAEIAELTVYQGALYLIANTTDDPAPKRGLWRSDGTTDGTVLLKEFAPGAEYPAIPPPIQLRPLASGLVLVADDGVHGREIWHSDGTAAGTILLRDITPGAGGSGITGFQVAAGRVFFSADDGVHGFELWQSDGTAAGTRLVQDIAPEGASSYPASLTVAGDRLFFTADDGSTGDELWVLPLSGPACQPSSSALCLSGGRFQVKAAWRDFAGRTGAGTAVPLSGDTGYFWFFAASNVETVLKVLDGTPLNGHFWVFYGALSNVEYTLTVTDSQTGLARRYFNPSGPSPASATLPGSAPSARTTRRPAW